MSQTIAYREGLPKGDMTYRISSPSAEGGSGTGSPTPPEAPTPPPKKITCQMWHVRGRGVDYVQVPLLGGTPLEAGHTLVNIPTILIHTFHDCKMLFGFLHWILE